MTLEIDGLHRIFKEKRQLAQDFARVPAPTQADAIRDKVASAFSSFPSRLPSSDGMKKDAEDLFAELTKQLQSLEEMVADTYHEFEKEFKGRYLDSISDDTVEQLGQLKEWNDLRSRFRERKDPDILRKLKGKIEDPRPLLEVVSACPGDPPRSPLTRYGASPSSRGCCRELGGPHRRRCRSAYGSRGGPSRGELAGPASAKLQLHRDVHRGRVEVWRLSQGDLASSAGHIASGTGTSALARYAAADARFNGIATYWKCTIRVAARCIMWRVAMLRLSENS